MGKKLVSVYFSLRQSELTPIIRPATCLARAFVNPTMAALVEE